MRYGRWVFSERRQGVNFLFSLNHEGRFLVRKPGVSSHDCVKWWSLAQGKDSQASGSGRIWINWLMCICWRTAWRSVGPDPLTSSCMCSRVACRADHSWRVEVGWHGRICAVLTSGLHSLLDDLCQEPSNEGGTVIQKENHYNFKKKGAGLNPS